MIDLRKAKKQKGKKSFRTVSSVRKRPPVISKDYPPPKTLFHVFFFWGEGVGAFTSYGISRKRKRKKKKGWLLHYTYTHTDIDRQ